VSCLKSSQGIAVDEERLIDLETKLSHQEHLLGELDDALTSQQAQIAQLELLCKSLLDRIKSLPEGDSGAGINDERPPHY
jgi:SlyX protein